MIRSLNIPDAMLERLKVLAEKKGVTVSAVIKMAIMEYLEREEKKK